MNMSSDPEQQYFSDGITEDIITKLSRFRSLFVIARNSAFQFRGAADVKQIARQLGVHYVVEGSVRRFGGSIRVTTQLIEADTGNHLWAQHYDRDIRDVFSVQDEIVHAIAATIEGRVAASGAQRSRSKPTSDLAAYHFSSRDARLLSGAATPKQPRSYFAVFSELDRNFAQALVFGLDGSISTGFISSCSQQDWTRQSNSRSRRCTSMRRTPGSRRPRPCLRDWRSPRFGWAPSRSRHGTQFDGYTITSQRANWLAYTGRGDEAVQSLDADLQRVLSRLHGFGIIGE